MQSLLDNNGLADVNSAAEKVKQAVEQQQFLKATELWSVTETVVEQVGTTLEPEHPKRFFKPTTHNNCDHSQLNRSTSLIEKWTQKSKKKKNGLHIYLLFV